MARKWTASGSPSACGPLSVRKEAVHLIADLGADRVYIRAIGPDVHGLMANYDNGGWQRIDDPRLSVLNEEI